MSESFGETLETFCVAETTCDVCHGDGQLLCGSCGGRGCDECGHTGDGPSCYACGGSGKVEKEQDHDYGN